MKASKSKSQVKTWVPTGFSALDKALGGGVPVGKITEASGKFSVGKSTLALSIVSQAQKMGLHTCYVDTEMSFDTGYAKSLGVNCDELDIIQERLGETVLDATEDWIMEHEQGLMVFDSVGMILPRSEAEKRAGETTVGAQARLFAPFLKKINTLLVEQQVGFFVCNHEGTNIMTGAITTPGGRAMEHFADIWVRMKKGTKKVMQGDKQVGKVIEALIWKNKLASTEGTEVDLMLVFGKGFNAEADLMGQASDKGIIKKSGMWWHFGDRKFKGDNGMREALKDEQLSQEIKALL